MESKRGALIVLGLLLVASVVLLVLCAKRGGSGDSGFDPKSAGKGILALFAKRQQFPSSDLEHDPFGAKGEFTLAGGKFESEVKVSDRDVRSATLELAGPGTVDVTFVAARDKDDARKGQLETHKRLTRSSASGDADDKAKLGLTAFQGKGKLTITIFGGPAATALLRWKVE